MTDKQRKNIYISPGTVDAFCKIARRLGVVVEQGGPYQGEPHLSKMIELVGAALDDGRIDPGLLLQQRLPTGGQASSDE